MASADDVRSWGRTTSLRARAEMQRLADMPVSDWWQADLTELRSALDAFEKLRREAAELGVDLGGRPLRNPPARPSQ